MILYYLLSTVYVLICFLLLVGGRFAYLIWTEPEFVQKVTVICPLLSGPISILELATKEEWNGKEEQAGGDHRQAA